MFLSWVPLVDDSVSVKERSYVNGLYVARITVNPSKGHVAYYYEVKDG